MKKSQQNTTRTVKKQSVLKTYDQGTRKPLRKANREVVNSKQYVQHILKGFQRKNYALILVHGIKEVDSGRILQYYHWQWARCVEDARFPGVNLWNDGVTFKLKGSINRDVCTF